jgi:hypothetical protein
MRHLKASALSYGIEPNRIITTGGYQGLGCFIFAGYPPETPGLPRVDPTAVLSLLRSTNMTSWASAGE